MLLFNTFQLGSLLLKNRVVMAPMTRNRATSDHTPTKLMAEYYGQRAEAGLIITEGTAPSANGVGYPRIPGIYNKEQVESWKMITAEVHAKGGKIFMQLMHTGRVSHSDNMPSGTKVLAPSGVGMSGEIYTDKNGQQPYPAPQAMTLTEIEETQEEFILASKNAIEAGFDGVELHGANGYLLDQFINPSTNKRSDTYGGSIENRSRFVIETAQKVATEIGATKTGIRLSPYGAFNDMVAFDGLEDAYEFLALELGKLKLAYIHIVDQSDMGAPEVPTSVKNKIKKAFGGNIIASGGFNAQKAEEALVADKGDLIAFGRPFISNPDLVYKMQNNIPLTAPDFSTLYTPGEKGYIDYESIETK